MSTQNNDEKRLVLIGIRRKGEKGFKTKTAKPFSHPKKPVFSEPVIIDKVHQSNATRIISILP